ncbi:branched-chain amino acid ABC transporter permease [uncultured Desulfuromonas sp.]|uniref:branched-chain amino acid ABC transporter permease n=1 Tax=uncultured Desulfuromonas sp. TaxID=181013 RepID=UPI002635D0DE|nr:branched-chain amino acid ABC transporter permease [uncultured Desulfuromonas sp.]
MTLKEKILYFLYLHRTGLTVLALSVALGLFPLVQDNPYILGLTNLIAIYTIVVLGLNLFIGYAGQISLGHAAFFGLGAYGSALLTVEAGVPSWPAMVLVAAIVSLVALVIGLAALRLAGHYLAMATLGFNIVVYTVLVQWDEVTGGPSGFAGIPSLSVAGVGIDDEIKLHYVVWGIALLCLTLGLNLVRSGVGRGLAALAGDETAAGALGVDTRRAKIKVFVLSAAFASVAGSLYAHTFNFVNPDTFGIFASVDFVIMVVVGGLGSIWGSLFGAAIITWLPELIDVFEAYKEIIHGLVLVLVLMFLPQGLVSGIVDVARVRIARWKGRHASAG